MTALEPGKTVHLLNGTKYAGRWELTKVAPVNAEGWVQITGFHDRPSPQVLGSIESMGVSWFTRAADAFDTEAEARAEGSRRRAPRRQRSAMLGDAGGWSAAAQIGGRL